MISSTNNILSKGLINHTSTTMHKVQPNTILDIIIIIFVMSENHTCIILCILPIRIK